MKSISLVRGQAGTGKTSWLASQIRTTAPLLLKNGQQSVLAITRMHGARRRIDVKFAESCPGTPISVSTIHGFALSIVNKWRTALGHSCPIRASDGVGGFRESEFGTEANFDEVLGQAAALFSRQTVRTLLGCTYPLIVVDEFQDCHGILLEFVKGMSSCSNLLLAGDDFQLLDADIAGCPALEWVQETHAAGNAEICDLGEDQHRFTGSIERAAHALRRERQSAEVTIPVVSCPTAPLAAWRVISKIALGAPWRGTTAIIATSGTDTFARDVLRACDKQLLKRNKPSIGWSVEKGEKADGEKVLKEAKRLLGSSDRADLTDVNPLAVVAIERAKRYAKLRGMEVTQELLVRAVETIVHERRAYQPQNRPKVVLTVHGAKNREFDNVFVLWGYKLPPSLGAQRRLLYNAVTRAKKNCAVLVLNPDNRLDKDPVLQLLGPPEPALRSKDAGAKVKTAHQ